jgi:hypothetical protein
MAFCNSCGTALDTGTKFCNKCGAAQTTAASTGPAATPAAPPQQGGGSAVKIILIIVAIIVGLGIIGIGTVTYIGYRIAKSSHVTQKNGKVSIESPLGNIETNNDPAEQARDLGVDLYPGAQAQKNGSVSMTIAGMHTATSVLQTEDSATQVADFYRSKMPNANFSGQGDSYTLSSGDRADLTSVTIHGDGSKTMIQITRVKKASN